MGDSRLCERDCCSRPKLAVTEMVKVRISRRQLEEILLGRVGVEELPVNQAVAQLLTSASNRATHHRTWRPALQSIPEAN
ncbi:hypothetical protein SAY87_012669 [Trapa incisa]|uniref:Uncharacterized protein n=1 Tax=Trapa incisa TaxID=236973 RepID=A0AAN7GTS1_9MYRT|nr:hypothetical protein SAY87_012669 [Trapa incisa]